MLMVLRLALKSRDREDLGHGQRFGGGGKQGARGSLDRLAAAGGLLCASHPRSRDGDGIISLVVVKTQTELRCVDKGGAVEQERSAQSLLQTCPPALRGQSVKKLPPLGRHRGFPNRVRDRAVIRSSRLGADGLVGCSTSSQATVCIWNPGVSAQRSDQHSHTLRIHTPHFWVGHGQRVGIRHGPRCTVGPAALGVHPGWAWYPQGFSSM